ncbi:MAG: radical SAM protein [Anaerolineae bacterium]|nr:radical SAM protein [Anaerolineae bacterium]
MKALEKLQLLGPAASYEPAEEVAMQGTAAPPTADPSLAGSVYRAVMPGGKRIALLKTLLTSACEQNCRYCPFRAGRDFRRATFSPDELAAIFMQLYRQNAVAGIFLSSAIAGGATRVQERLIDTAQILRRSGFGGYIHLKIMPGAERDQIRAAMSLADRVSLNLEAPNPQRLQCLAPKKVFDDDLYQRLKWVHEIRRESGGRGPSSATQFVVGPAGESDLELLAVTVRLYHDLGLARAYYSSFRPVADTPLADSAPSPPLREHRLYQASFLLRDYGFDLEEMPFDDDGNLPHHVDPKLAWAQRDLTEQPVELNRAGYELLLRVPGIGPKGARQLLAARRRGTLRDLGDLRRLRIAADRAAPFILLDGRRPARQLSFWST